ncbi:MAG: serine protease [Litorilinea sp.]
MFKLLPIPRPASHTRAGITLPSTTPTATMPSATRAFLLGGLLCLLVTVFGASSALPVFSQSRDQTTHALLATVQIIMPDENIEDISLGSGTIMNDSGLVLTNHHVVEGNASNGLMNEAGTVLIALTPDDLRGEAVLKYFGVVVKTDPELDLALVQINALLDDPEAALPANLGLTAIPRGDTSELMISDTINIFGYPGIGGNTPTLTRGLVSGFLDDDRNGIYEWIKTDAVLSSGNSGGLATNDQGQFVGVPTAGRFIDASQLGLVRSGDLALAFVDGYFPTATTDGPAIPVVEFATGVNRRNEPINPARHFASGTTDIYAVFQHRNFGDGLPFSAIWRLGDEVLARDDFQWDDGASGATWVSLNIEQGLSDGYLELEMLFNNTVVYRGGVTLGEGRPSLPVGEAGEFGPITFALGMAGTQPIEPNDTFSDLDKVFALFDYANMQDGTSWHTRWYLDGTHVLEQAQLWDGGPEGVYYVTLSHPDGLPAGDFRLELYLEDELVQSAEFTVNAGQGAIARGVNVIGTLRDRDNQRRLINGALVMVLEPGTSTQDWLSDDMSAGAVIAQGTSNREGVFRLDAPLIPGETYALVIMHDRYRTIALDDLAIPPDATDPYRLDVNLQRN